MIEMPSAILGTIFYRGMTMGLFSLAFCAFALAPPAFALAKDEFSPYDISEYNLDRSISRILQQSNNDFDRVNELLGTVTINIEDDMTISEKVGFINLNLVVDSLVCRDISIGNMNVNHVTEDNVIDVDISLDEIDVACDIEYQYEYGFLKGTGLAEIVTDGNMADTSMRFVTSNKGGDISVTSSVTKCVVDVEIIDVNFIDADFASNIIGLFEQYLRDLIEEEIEGYACSQLSSTGVTMLNDEVFTMIDETLSDLSATEDTGSSLQPNDYDTTTALNFKDIAETQIGELFETALGEIDQLFGSNEDSGSELGINALLKSYVLNENGALVVNVDELLGQDALNFELHDKLTKTSIAVKEVRIYGLDSMIKFNPLVVVGNHSLSNEFVWDYLNMEIDIALDIQPSSLEKALLILGADSPSKGINEEITIRFGVEDVAVIARIFLLIDVNALSGFTIGSVLALTNTADYSWLLPCLMSAIQDLVFTELTVSSKQISSPTLEGFVDDGLDRILSDLAEIAFEMYHDVMVEDLLPNMFHNTVKTFVNDQISLILEDSSSNCPKYESVSIDGSEEYVDFREFFDSSFSTESKSQYGEFPSLLMDAVNKGLLENDLTTGMPKINEVLVDPLTKRQSGTEGTLLFGGDGEDIFNIVQRINLGGFNANVRLRASDIKIENLNTLSAPLVMLQPVPNEPYMLNNNLTIGVKDHPLRVSANVAFAVIDEVQGTEIANELDISFDMYSANAMATIMLKILKSNLLEFPLIDVFDLNCWIATIPAPSLNAQGVTTGEDEVSASVVDFQASVANLNLNVSCVECSSPGIVEFTETLMLSGEAQNDVTFLANTLLLSAADVIKGNLLQVQIDRLLNDASKQCRHSPTYDPNFSPSNISAKKRKYKDFDTIQIEDSATFLILIGVIFLSLILVVAAVVFSIRCVTRRRHRRWLSTLPIEQVEVLKNIQRNEDSMEFNLNSTTRSMFQSAEDIPCVLRWGMPIIILGNIALFLSGHLSLGATVKIVATIAGETIEVDDFFEFSVAKSTIDIWNSGGKALAILILIFSGIWPYTKQMATLVLWFTPTSWVPISRRGSILVWLDRLAKWSMIDIFVLIVCLAAFRVTVNSPANFAILPNDFYSLDLLVVPLWGLYANLIAQLISQISSHFIIHYHRKIAEKARISYLKTSTNLSLEKIEDDCDQKVLLRTHKFSRPRRGEDEKLIVRPWTSSMLIFLVLSLIACIIAGCTLPSFSIEVFGLLGIAVEMGQEFREANTNHSAFTVIQLIFEEAQFLDTVKDVVGLGSFSVIFVATILLVPIAQSIFLLGHWFVPMTMKRRRKMIVLNEIFQAWQYAEVYIISIFVASWQLAPISSFMVNSYCGSLDGFFSELVFYGILKNEDAQCFSVKSSIEDGFFVLATGAVILALVNTFVVKATMQYFQDQDESNKRIQIETYTTRLESGEKGQEAANEDSQVTIRPVPVLFTDTFRWLLRQDEEANKVLNSREPSCDSNSSMHCSSAKVQ